MANNMIVDEEYIKAEAENIKTIFLKIDGIYSVCQKASGKLR